VLKNHSSGINKEMKSSVSAMTMIAVLAIFVGLFFGTINVVVPSAYGAPPPKSPLQSETHVTTISGHDPLPGHHALTENSG
jgi:hypothetical protein